MLQRYLLPAGAPLQARAYGTVLSACGVQYQRGGFHNRGDGAHSGGGGGGGGRGGRAPHQQRYQERGGMHGDRDSFSREGGGGYGGYENRGHGYVNRRPDDGGYGHDNAGQQHQQQQRYDDRSARHGGQQQGYGNRRQSYDEGGQGYSDRRQGYDNRQRGRGGGRQHDRGAAEFAPRRGKEQYLAQDADALMKTKQELKRVKSLKERGAIMKEGRRLLRRVRVDPSTQDERSVAIVVNCAAAFQAPGNLDGVASALQWMRSNIRGISPQNVALFTNALGVTEPPNVRQVVVNEVMPAVQSVMRDMTPVEVVMVLQAFQRLFITENEKLQIELLAQLEPCISTMPIPVLSTLASVLSRHPMRKQDNDRWKRIVQATLSRCVASPEIVHSKEAVVLVCAVTGLETSQEVVCKLLTRVTETAKFHTDEQVGELLSAITDIRQANNEPTPALTEAIEALHRALMERLEKVSSFVRFGSASRIWQYVNACDGELSSTVEDNICTGLISAITFSNPRYPAVCRVLRDLAKHKLRSTEILHACATYLAGVRPPRSLKTDSPHEIEVPDDDGDRDGVRAAALDALNSRFLGSLTEARIALEDAFALNGVPPCEAVTKTLPENLIRHVDTAPPEQLLRAVESILLAPADCLYRNKAHDQAILAAARKRVTSDPESMRSTLTRADVEGFEQRTSGVPGAQEFVQVLGKCVAE
ncbi:mitochondrial oligo-U binding protein TBRGG1 [Novymonas esmeraldas]|uniref:Mitochondrial oligo-U binding protein TBRGG1 n=1 Tax=Novymonas esmeraldas TaxID=1808958 RepID=A0AAW0F435_9TRYP